MIGGRKIVTILSGCGRTRLPPWWVSVLQKAAGGHVHTLVASTTVKDKTTKLTILIVDGLVLQGELKWALLHKRYTWPLVGWHILQLGPSWALTATSQEMLAQQLFQMEDFQ